MVFGLELQKLDDLRGKIFEHLSFVELARDNFSQLGRDNTQIFDAKYFGIADPDEMTRCRKVCFFFSRKWRIDFPARSVSPRIVFGINWEHIRLWFREMTTRCCSDRWLNTYRV